MKKRRTIREHMEKLKAKKQYEEGRDFSKLIKAAFLRLDRNIEKLEASKEKESDLSKQVAEMKAKLADAESVLKEASDHEKEQETKVQDKQKEYKESQAEQLDMSKKNEYCWEYARTSSCQTS